MSYALNVSAQARAILATLDFDLQERTYDELDDLAANPGVLRFSTADETAVRDLTVRLQDGVHYIFLTLKRDDAARLLRVEAIGHVVKPLGG